MHPVSRKSLSSDRFSLCYLVLMMWKYQINSTHMDIYLLAMSPEITGATFYMPTWSSFQKDMSRFSSKFRVKGSKLRIF